MSTLAESVMGGMFLEMFIACMLYGLTTLQTVLYFQKHPDDAKLLKILVGTVWALETAHTIFCIEFVYEYLIQGFGDYITFLRINWGVGITILCSAGIGICVQGYYTWRVWIVSERSMFLTGVIGVFAVARLGFAIASAVLCYVYPSWPVIRNKTFSLVTVSGGLGSAALVDILVAGILTFYLKRRRSPAPWAPESNTVVNRVLVYVVNTGAITSTASLLCAILFAVETDSLAFLGLVEIQAKLYANSFLGSLNARSLMRGNSTGTIRTFSSFSTSPTSLRPPRAQVLAVYHHTVVEDDRSPSSTENPHFNHRSGISIKDSKLV